MWKAIALWTSSPPSVIIDYTMNSSLARRQLWEHYYYNVHRRFGQRSPPPNNDDDTCRTAGPRRERGGKKFLESNFDSMSSHKSNLKVSSPGRPGIKKRRKEKEEYEELVN